MAEYTTIDDPSAYFQADTYTGTSSATDSIVFDGNSDLQPDLLWAKSIETAYWHQTIDSTRGAGTGQVYPNTTGAEAGTGITSFDSDGWTGNVGNDAIHTNGDDCVCWAWKANAGTTSSATTTDGIASATRQVDSTSKFSIIGYTSESTQAVGTIEHGLGVAPEFMLIKRRPQTDNWAVYHHKNTAAPETELLALNSTAATTDIATAWNDTAPTSSVFTLGALSDVNEGSGVTYIAYCWAGVHGYSKFGSYVGNGDSALGAYVYTGFQPYWVMIKSSGTGTADDSWFICDQKRPGYGNVCIDMLRANDASVEVETPINLYSNGFQIGNAYTGLNGSDKTYIYAAFAKHPLVSSSTGGSIPTTAF